MHFDPVFHMYVHIYKVTHIWKLVILFLQVYGANKYYRFRNGPPAYYSDLCYIFRGTHATGSLRYASTQSPLDSDDERRGVDLNRSPAIVDLTKPQEQMPPPRSSGKSKRRASPSQSQRSSKRTP